jgi:VanZ family protein
MALINCYECNKAISNQSDFCVGCGAPRMVFTQSRVNPFIDLVADEPSLDTSGNSVCESGPDEITSDSEIYNNILDYDVTDHNLANTSSESSNTENIEIKFNTDDPDYRIFKIANIVLLFILTFLEMGYAAAEGRRGNVLAVYITFLISRWVIRYFYKKNSDLRKAIVGYKVGAVFAIWIFVFILKLILAIFVLNIAL